MKRKTYVLDTSVLIEDPNVLYKLRGDEIIIPTAVLKEIDGLKRDPDPDSRRAKAARQVVRNLDRLGSYQDISTGAKTSSGSIVRICTQYKIIDDLESNADNRIVGTAIRLKENCDGQVILVSTDGNMRNVTRSYKMRAENYPFRQGDTTETPKAGFLNEKGHSGNRRGSPHPRAGTNVLTQEVSRRGYVYGVTLLMLLIYLIMGAQ